MRRLVAAGLSTLALALFGPAALASTAAPAPISGAEIVVTYARHALQFFIVASAERGATIALPLVPGAQALHVRGGSYRVRGGSLQVTAAGGTVTANYAVPAPNNADYLVHLQFASPVGHALLLAGPGVHPSGLGLEPFRLMGSVQIAGKPLTGFRADFLRAGTTVRWEFEVGQPGYLLGDLFTALLFLVPLLALTGAVAAVVRRRRGHGGPAAEGGRSAP